MRIRLLVERQGKRPPGHLKGLDRQRHHHRDLRPRREQSQFPFPQKSDDERPLQRRDGGRHGANDAVGRGEQHHGLQIPPIRRPDQPAPAKPEPEQSEDRPRPQKNAEDFGQTDIEPKQSDQQRRHGNDRRAQGNRQKLGPGKRPFEDVLGKVDQHQKRDLQQQQLDEAAIDARLPRPSGQSIRPEPQEEQGERKHPRLEEKRLRNDRPPGLRIGVLVEESRDGGVLPENKKDGQQGNADVQEIVHPVGFDREMPGQHGEGQQRERLVEGCRPSVEDGILRQKPQSLAQCQAAGVIAVHGSVPTIFWPGRCRCGH